MVHKKAHTSVQKKLKKKNQIKDKRNH